MIEAILSLWAATAGSGWLLGLIVAGSFASLLISGALVGVVLVRLPVDHYSHLHIGGEARAAFPGLGTGFGGGVLTGIVFVARNVLGWVFVLAGVAMLVLPGQGLLSILAGLVLVNFPGKQRLERRLLSSHVVQEAVNWLRRRAGRPPFEFS